MESKTVNLFTIGFTKKSAEGFFTKLKDAGVRRVIDARLNAKSQLSGFAKRNDLEFFLKLIGIEYLNAPLLTPTADMLRVYKKEKGSWETYENTFMQLMAARKIEEHMEPDLFDYSCLLCSEHEPNHCHRRLVAEYLQQKWLDVKITHLL